ncbi:MAG TPA: hypothetical protein VFE51_07710 [Verrucomicrobiae bacterium]|nr:hypothetical protein [Verrucomicrobiae bacterium]
MYERHAIHIVLRDGCGRYLAGNQNSWSFTEDFKQAHVFDFIRDRIAEQLDVLQREEGLVLSVIAVDPLERYEICDRCGQRSMPYSIFFDGQQYLCAVCQGTSKSYET